MIFVQKRKDLKLVEVVCIWNSPGRRQEVSGRSHMVLGGGARDVSNLRNRQNPREICVKTTNADAANDILQSKAAQKAGENA